MAISIWTKWHVEFTERNTRTIAERIQLVIDEAWSSSLHCVARRQLKAVLDPEEMGMAVRNRRYDSMGTNFRSRSLSRYVSFSPLSGKDLSVSFSDDEFGQLRVYFRVDKSIVGEVLPNEQEIRQYRGWYDGMFKSDSRWQQNFPPAWPANAKVMKEIASSIEGLFPLVELKISPEIAEPEKFICMGA
ncbi:hypothetical protein [Planctomicrobium piriforme]|uniref:Uncharacterized protein n=1 Tax=Planctomicrobium piriforme TaxID=1576369 RepID=A0A1I3FH51_9PLAN|nr:hypothetical protein [Planctomicrobium piriforme]SFI10549.1 hypothetical protein SAMN05421753_105247 [Planctomicrobium piriforme]